MIGRWGRDVRLGEAVEESGQDQLRRVLNSHVGEQGEQCIHFDDVARSLSDDSVGVDERWSGTDVGDQTDRLAIPLRNTPCDGEDGPAPWMLLLFRVILVAELSSRLAGNEVGDGGEEGVE